MIRFMIDKINEALISPPMRDLGREMSDATIRMHEAIALKAGLTGTDHKYLGYLIGGEPTTAGQLARMTGLTTGAVTGLIDRLEKRQFVRRRYDDEDRRKIYIEPIRENIARAMGTTFIELQRRMGSMMAQFDEAEQRVIERYMRTVIGTMQAFTQDLREGKA